MEEGLTLLERRAQAVEGMFIALAVSLARGPGVADLGDTLRAAADEIQDGDQHCPDCAHAIAGHMRYLAHHVEATIQARVARLS
jgi:hypothetical protein